jgi:PAS domain S-box-containing protein
MKVSLQAALDHVVHSFIAVDATGLICHCNRQAIELLDVPGAVLERGQPFAQLMQLQRQRGDFANGFWPIASLTPQPLQDTADPALRGDRVRYRRGGTWLEACTRDLPDGGLVQTFFDVTAEIESQAALRNSESEAQMILKGLPGFIGVTDASFRYAYLNDWAISFIGRPREALIGRPIRENVPPARYAEIVEFMTTSRTGEQSTAESFYPASGKGPQRWLQVTQVMKDDPSSGDRKCYVYAIDITKQREAEFAIVAAKEEAEKARAVSDHLRFLADEARGNLQRLSELGRRLTGSLDPNVIFDTLRAGLPALMGDDSLLIVDVDSSGRLQPADERLAGTIADVDDADEHVQALKRCIAGTQVISLTRSETGAAWPTAPKGSRSALLAPLVFQQGSAGLLIVYSSDPAPRTTAQLAMLETLALHVASAISNSRAYARLQLAQEQLVEREKMAALGSLVAGVAHELNTPLGNALLLTSTLNERARALPEAQAPIDHPMQAFWELRQLVRQTGGLIESSLRSAATLVSSFKQVAADQTTDRRRSFELGQVVRELMATLHNQLQPHRHQLVLEIPAGILMDSYPGSLNQVLTNLTINALQHGLEGRSNGRIAIRATRHENEVTIEFSDNGGGISDAHLRRVFEPFFTTRLGRGGTGLGLSISYNIVTSLLGGSIQVSSPAGSGATFRLRIPMTAPMREAGPPSSEPS